jgi:exosortase
MADKSIGGSTDVASLHFRLGGWVSQSSSNLSYADPGTLIPAKGTTDPLYLGLTLPTLLKTLIVGVLFIATFRFDLHRLWDKTNPIYGDANWGHAIFVPIVGLWYLYTHREELRQTPVEPLLAGRFTRKRFISAGVVAVLGLALYLIGSNLLSQNLLMAPITGAGIGLMILGIMVAALDWGIGLLLWGILVFQYGIWPGRNDWTSDAGMMVTLFGVVLLLCGWKVMRIVWFPLVFMMCAVPWPPLLYSKVAMPLQVLAAKVAVFTLNLTGVDAVQNGTKIFMPRTGMPDRSLNVAEACAGMRSLMTFVSVGAAIAFLSNRPLWQKLIIVFSAVPIAIFCNVMRVSGQGLLDHYFSEQLSEGFAHAFVGLIMLLPALFLILGVCWVLDQLFVEEAEEKASQTPGIIRARRRRNNGGEDK